MKAQIGKQEAAYRAVKEYRQENPEASLKEAIGFVAKKTKSTNGSVHAAYYTHARRNGDALAHRTPRASTTAAPPKKKTTKVKKTKQASSASLDLNILRVSLNNALNAIDALESENNKNKKIIRDLRQTLSV